MFYYTDKYLLDNFNQSLTQYKKNKRYFVFMKTLIHSTVTSSKTSGPVNMGYFNTKEITRSRQ